MADKKRRQYGTGGISQRSDGRWMGRFDDGFNTKGKRKVVYVYGKTESEVKTKLKEKQRDQNSDEGLSEVSVRTTVKAWSDLWLVERQKVVRPKSFATEQSAVRQWIVPTIGHKRLETLTPSDVRKVENAQRAAGRSTSTANRTHSTINTMLADAILEGHKVPRRVLDVRRPTVAVNDRTDMPVPEALAMLQVASFLPHGSRWAMAFLHGLRQAECLGLTWESVNLDLGFFTTQWQLQPLPYLDRTQKHLGFKIPDGYESQQLTGGFHLTRPKTKKGYRVTPMIPAMVEALRDWKEIAPANEWGLIWPRLNGMPTNDKDDREEWYALQCTAEVGHPNGRYYALHEARHTTAQAVLEAGIDEHDATALMGHSSIRTTRGYQHPSQRAALTALVAIGERFGIGSATTLSELGGAASHASPTIDATPQ